MTDASRPKLWSSVYLPPSIRVLSSTSKDAISAWRVKREAYRTQIFPAQSNAAASGTPVPISMSVTDTIESTILLNWNCLHGDVFVEAEKKPAGSGRTGGTKRNGGLFHGNGYYSHTRRGPCHD